MLHDLVIEASMKAGEVTLSANIEDREGSQYAVGLFADLATGA